MIRDSFRSVLFLVCITLTSHVLGNDTFARVGVGGIQHLKTESVKMAREVLEISLTKVTVDYEFVNETPTEVTTLIAFPTPAFTWVPEDEAPVFSNFLPLSDFRVSADGVPIRVGRISRALYAENGCDVAVAWECAGGKKSRDAGKDITAELRSAGLTDQEIFETFASCKTKGCSYPKSNLKQLQQRHLVNERLHPNWAVETTLTWDQTFPAGKAVHVSHSYSPFVGLGPAEYVDRVDAAASGKWTPRVRSEVDEACDSEGAQRVIASKVKRKLSEGAKSVRVALRSVEYVLETGKNWKGPIGDFTLRIKKEDPAQVVSLCFPGQSVRRDLLTIEFHQENFVPQRNLVVYFYDIKAE